MFSGIGRRMSSFIFGASPAQTSGAVSDDTLLIARFNLFGISLLRSLFCWFFLKFFLLVWFPFQAL